MKFAFDRAFSFLCCTSSLDASMTLPLFGVVNPLSDLIILKLLLVSINLALLPICCEDILDYGRQQ